MRTTVTYACKCGHVNHFEVPTSLDAIYGDERCTDCGREFSSADHEWILQQAYSLQTTGERLKL